MFLLALLLTPWFGWMLLPPRLHLGTVGRLGLAFAAGAAAVSVQMFFFDLAGIPWGRASLLIPWAVATAAFLYVRKPKLDFSDWRNPDPWVVLGALLALAPAVIWLPYERLMPLTSQSWDAWAIWLLKAKAFYVDGGISPFLDRAAGFNTQPGYPLLVPLYGTYLYEMAGAADAHAAKLMTPVFFLALLGVFYGFVRRFGSRRVAVFFTAMLASMPLTGRVAFEKAGYADTPLSLFIVAAAGFLYAWLRSGQVTDLALASAAATAAAWTKNEGQVVLAGVVGVAAIRLVLSRGSPRAWAALVVPPLLVLAPWTYVRQAHDIMAAGFTPLLDFHPGLFLTALQTLLALAAQPTLLNLTFYLFAASLVGAVWLKVHGPFWSLPGLVLLHLAVALLAYATGRNDLQWWLGTSADRILAQIAPLALLPPALEFSRWTHQVAEQHARTASSAGPSPSQARVGDRRKRKGKRKRSNRGGV